MDINGWLTVITIILALMAIMPKEDMKHLQMTLPRFEKYFMAVVIFFFIPVLILFYDLSDICTGLKYFTVAWGLNPQLLAFFTFYVFVIWLLVRLFILKPKNAINDKLMNYYKDLLYQKPFDEFASFLLKYHSTKAITKNWKYYRPIFLDVKFLQGLGKNRRVAYFISQFIDLIKNEEDFKSLFSIFLENEDSILYDELRLEPSAYSISETPLLNILIKKNLNQSIKFKMLNIIEDNTVKYLAKQDLIDTYNKPFKYPANATVGHDWPTYFHLRLIELIYETAIVDNINVHGIRQTLMQSITDRMVNNMNFKGLNLNSEYPSIYFFLLHKVFDIHSDWSGKLANGEVKNTNVLNDYVNFSYGLCIEKITEGKVGSVMPKRFIQSVGHYDFLTIYFRHDTEEEYLSYMETEVILKLVVKTLVSILEKTLDEDFAKSISYFVKGQFTKNSRLERLFTVLDENGKIQEIKDWLNEG